MNREILLPVPLFRDPIYDCPTDPTVIWNREEKQWYLFYTQRRATDTAVGVSWVHGTKNRRRRQRGRSQMALPRYTGGS